MSLTLPRANQDNSNLGTAYDDLVVENLALRAQLYASTSTDTENAPHSEDDLFILDETTGSFGLHLFDSLTDVHLPRSVLNYKDVEFPTKQKSDYLIRQARERIAWIHYALHHPTFEREHDDFWAQNRSRSAQLAHDPAWLAIYFSTLSVSFLIYPYQQTFIVAGSAGVSS